MARLTIHSLNTAPAASQERVSAALKANGFLPNLIGVLASAPAALATYQEVGKINNETSLTSSEREVVQITAAKLNGCAFCVAGHSKVSTLKKLFSPDELENIRNLAVLNDEKFNALANFTRAVILQKGNVSDDELQAFLAAGYSEQAALEVVLGVSLATLCNYANNLARTEINPELSAFA